MVLTGVMRTLPDGFDELVTTDAMRELLDTHVFNMGVCTEAALKHSALAIYIESE